MRVADVAALIKAKIHVPGGGRIPDVDIRGVAPIATAGPGDLSFIADPAFAPQLVTTRASAVIVGKAQDDAPSHTLQLVHDNPYYAFAVAAQAFWQPSRPKAGVSAQAFVDASASVDQSAAILPFAYIGPGAKVGPRAVMYPGAYLGPEAELGADSELRANAVVEAHCQIGKRVLIHAGSVVGADGFGFAPGQDGIAKIPQTGRVIVGDDVEIGGCSTVDRGALDDTVIGRGCKLDSHVHVGHNVTMGEHSMLCGLSGIAGSARVGRRVVIAGHSGISNKVRVADGVVVGGMTGAVTDLDEPGEYVGFPARPIAQWKRQVAYLARLGELNKKVSQLESIVTTLERRVADLKPGC